MEEKNSKPEKLTDKAFTRLMLTSVLGILLCLTCLCSVTWAWFGADISAKDNKIQSACFDLDILVEDGGAARLSPINAVADGREYELREVGIYTVTLKMSASSTASKGYCKIVIGEDAYCTASITREADSYVFYIDVKTAGAKVSFDPVWGYIADSDLIAAGGVVAYSGEGN